MQRTLPEMNQSLHVDMDAIESASTLSDSILLCISDENGVYQTGNALELLDVGSSARIWKVIIRLSTVLIQIVDSTMARSAALIEATMSTHLQSTPPTLDSEFVLHTRKVCNSANIASNVPVLCVVDADCNNDPAAPSQDVKCNATTAYLQSTLVDTNSQSQDIDATPADPVMLRMQSVKFDMAALEWKIVLQIRTTDPHSPQFLHSLFLSKTLTKDAKRVFVPTPLVCGTMPPPLHTFNAWHSFVGTCPCRLSGANEGP